MSAAMTVTRAISRIAGYRKNVFFLMIECQNGSVDRVLNPGTGDQGFEIHADHSVMGLGDSTSQPHPPAALTPNFLYEYIK